MSNKFLGPGLVAGVFCHVVFHMQTGVLIPWAEQGTLINYFTFY